MNTVESFEPLRPTLFSLAYRMLGSVSDAEDIVQESFLRPQHALDEGTDVTATDDAGTFDGTIFGAAWLNDGPECP